MLQDHPEFRWGERGLTTLLSVGADMMGHLDSWKTFGSIDDLGESAVLNLKQYHRWWVDEIK